MTVPTDPAERLSEAPSPALQSALDAAKDSARTAAYAPETLRAYTHDWQAFCHWCDEHGTSPLPAAPPIVAAWLHSLAPRFSRSALNRRLAAIGYQHRMRGLEWSSGHAAIRTTLRAAGRVYGAPQKQAAALTSQELRKLVAPEHSKTVEALADLRDRALLLIGFAGALRRSELVALTTETVRIVGTGVKLHIAHSKTDPEHRGEDIFLPRGKHRETCPVLALERWLKKAEIMDGPLFRSINRWEQVGRDALHPDAVRQILLRRARVAGLKVPSGERLSPHGLRAGFVTEAFRANARDEQIMAHTRHRDLRSMRRYVRRARLDLDSPAHLLDL